MSSSASDTASIMKNLEDLNYGPLLLASFVTFGLFGIIYLQVYTYYTGNLVHKDPFYLKFMIGVLMCIEIFLTAANSHMAYYLLVSNFGNPAALASPIWSLTVPQAVREFDMLLIRCMFLRRLFVMSKRSIILTVWVIFWSVVETAAATYLAVAISQMETLGVHYSNTIYQVVYVADASCLVAEISLAVALCYYLYTSRTGFKNSDSVIRILILYTVNSTVLVVITAILATALFIHSSSYIDWPPYMAQTRLYFISYLATINARDGLRNRGDTEPLSFHLSHLSSTNVPTSTRNGVLSIEKPNDSINMMSSVDTYPTKRNEGGY